MAVQLDKILIFSQSIATGVANFKTAAGADIDLLEVAVQDVTLKTRKDAGLSDTLAGCLGRYCFCPIAQDAVLSSSAYLWDNRIFPDASPSQCQDLERLQV
jgi:hypothetical protein